MIDPKEPVWGQRIRRMRAGEVVIILPTEGSASTVRRWASEIAKDLECTILTKARLHGVYVGMVTWPDLKSKSRGLAFGSRERKAAGL